MQVSCGLLCCVCIISMHFQNETRLKQYCFTVCADHSGTPDDTVNFNLLLDDVRAALDELGEEKGRF